MGLKEALLPRVSLFSRQRSETISEDGDFHHDILDYKQKSIRVLKILPSRRKAPVRCVLEETTIGRAKYTCLSYRWGDRGENNPTIEVNGKTFHVHQNLFDFLKVARQSNRRRTYWIDAICIDQQNIHEKNHQVRLMGEIYKHADDVVLWLGKGDQVSEDVIAFINSTRDYIKRTADVETIWENLGNRSWDGIWEAYAQVCKNEYWRRAWIVQEVVLARQKTILQGDQTVNWPTFVEFWNKATTGKPFQPPPDTLKRLESSPLASIVKIAGTENSWKPKSLVELLPTQGLMHCTRVQDRIYSLLPLCIERDRLLPDYDIDHLGLLLQTIDACKRPSDTEAPPNVVPFVHHLVKILELWESDLATLDEDTPYIEVAVSSWPMSDYLGGTTRNEEVECCFLYDVVDSRLSDKKYMVCCLYDSCMYLPIHLRFSEGSARQEWDYHGGWRYKQDLVDFERLDGADSIFSKVKLRRREAGSGEALQSNWILRLSRLVFLELVVRERYYYEQANFWGCQSYGHRFCNP